MSNHNCDSVFGKTIQVPIVWQVTSLIEMQIAPEETIEEIQGRIYKGSIPEQGEYIKTE